MDGIARSLQEEQDSREFLIRNTRDVVILCSQSIMSVHRGDMGAAKEKAAEASALLRAHRKRARGGLRRHLAVPEQEMVEALALIAVAEGARVPGAGRLGAPGGAYVLGLLDCIGELKRLVLDSIRAGRPREAQRVFGAMEEMYDMLYPFASFDKVVKEARRKTDVARSLVESARAAVTEEARRSEVMAAFAAVAAGAEGKRRR